MTCLLPDSPTSPKTSAPGEIRRTPDRPRRPARIRGRIGPGRTGGRARGPAGRSGRGGRIGPGRTGGQARGCAGRIGRGGWIGPAGRIRGRVCGPAGRTGGVGVRSADRRAVTAQPEGAADRSDPDAALAPPAVGRCSVPRRFSARIVRVGRGGRRRLGRLRRRPLGHLHLPDRRRPAGAQPVADQQVGTDDPAGADPRASTSATPPLHRLLGIAVLRIDTGASGDEKQEGELNGVTVAEAERLKAVLLGMPAPGRRDALRRVNRSRTDPTSRRDRRAGRPPPPAAVEAPATRRRPRGR